MAFTQRMADTAFIAQLKNAFTLIMTSQNQKQETNFFPSKNATVSEH